MARLLREGEPESNYVDRRFKGTLEEYYEALRESTTLYVGNLAHVTKEEQIYALFSRCGPVKRVIMGLDRNDKTPCGFCFVQYYCREDTEAAVKYLAGSTLDDSDIRVDFDWGFQEGRQYGRGKGGGQVRDDFRAPPNLQEAVSAQPEGNIEAGGKRLLHEEAGHRPAKRQRHDGDDA